MPPHVKYLVPLLLSGSSPQSVGLHKRGKFAANFDDIERNVQFDAKSRLMVPGEGFEPSRGLPRRILSAVRLPFRHPGWRDATKFTAQNPREMPQNPDPPMLSFRPDSLTQRGLAPAPGDHQAWLSTPLRNCKATT
jgi:hypothetical protein